MPLDNYNIDKLVNDTYNYTKSLKPADIVNILEELSANYYNTNTPLVSDDIFDIIWEVLEEVDPKNKYLLKVGAINKKSVKLPYYMPSLKKIKPDTGLLEKYVNKYKGPYVVSDKLDGVSGLYYINNGTEKLYTRGETDNGQDITHLIKYVIPKFNIGTIKQLAIRGELIISKKNFETIGNDYKNARNTVAGLVNAKEYSKEIAKITDFIGYSIIYPELKISEQLALLEKLGFPTVPYKIKKTIDNNFLSEYIVERRKNAIYNIDGLVVIDDSSIYKNSYDKPEYGFAFKKILKDQSAEVIVRDVEWNITRYGYIKPKIRIEPVNLVGVEITYATAHNAKFIFDNNIGPGAIITLIRSGDVIPNIQNIIKPASKPKMPDIPYKWNNTNVDIIAKNFTGKVLCDIKIKKITNFFKILKVKYISEGIVKKMVDNGYDNIIDIITANICDLSNIDGLGEKIIEKIKNNFNENIKKTNLHTLMAASNIFGRGFGVRRLKLIVNTYPNIMNVTWNENTLKDKINNIMGFDNVTTLQFIANFDKFKLFFKKLSKVVDLTHITKIGDTSNNIKNNLFNDKSFVFTGVRDKNVEEFIENNGGKISTSISGKTYMLIYLDEKVSSAKLQKALLLGVKTMPLVDFINKYKINNIL
jgi:DNA ligase (NAD+)